MFHLSHGCLTFGVVDHVDQVAPVALGRMQDALHQPNPPHALGLRVPVPQPARPWELCRHRGQQHRAVVLGRNLHGLLILVLGDADVHVGHVSEAESVRNQPELLVNATHQQTRVEGCFG